MSSRATRPFATRATIRSKCWRRRRTPRPSSRSSGTLRRRSGPSAPHRELSLTMPAAGRVTSSLDRPRRACAMRPAPSMDYHRFPRRKGRRKWSRIRRQSWSCPILFPLWRRPRHRPLRPAHRPPHRPPHLRRHAFHPHPRAPPRSPLFQGLSPLTREG